MTTPTAQAILELADRLTTMARWQRDNMTKSGVYNNFTNGSLAEEAATALCASQPAAQVPEPVAWAERINGKIVSVRLDPSVHCTEPLFARAPAGTGGDVDWNIRKFIDFLRADEGDSVTLLCDNLDFNGQPNCAVECNGYWTSWHDKRFIGDTLEAALKLAYFECRQWRENPPADVSPDPLSPPQAPDAVRAFSAAQCKLDASTTPDQAREYVRKERERNTTRDKPEPAPRDGFINDYD